MNPGTLSRADRIRRIGSVLLPPAVSLFGTARTIEVSARFDAGPVGAIAVATPSTARTRRTTSPAAGEVTRISAGVRMPVGAPPSSSVFSAS